MTACYLDTQLSYLLAWSSYKKETLSPILVFHSLSNRKKHNSLEVHLTLIPSGFPYSHQTQLIPCQLSWQCYQRKSMFHFRTVCHSKESIHDQGLADVSRHVLLTTRSFHPLNTPCRLSARNHLKYLRTSSPFAAWGRTIPWLQESSQHDGLKYKLHVGVLISDGFL